MERIKKIIYTNSELILLDLILVALFAVVGFFVHDLILLLVHDDDMTVFPLGTITSYFGIVLFVVFLSYQHGILRFSMNVGMGQTRKAFYIEQMSVRLALIIIDQFAAYGVYQLEKWKFRTFYPDWKIEMSLDGNLFSGKVMFLVSFGLFSISMFVMTLALFMGMKVSIVMVVLYFAALMILSKMNTILNYFGNVVYDVHTYLTAAYVVLCVLFAVLFVISVLLMPKTAV